MAEDFEKLRTAIQWSKLQLDDFRLSKALQHYPLFDTGKLLGSLLSDGTRTNISFNRLVDVNGLAVAVLQTLLQTNPYFDQWELLGKIKASHDPSQPDLVLLNYTHEATFKKPEDWNAFECVCRGLILERGTGRVVARPYDKFFNYGQVFPHPHAVITQVNEKLDGSLGIGYHYQGKWRMASRGSLTGDHAQWGQAQLDQCDLSSLSEDYTLLFEMVIPPDQGLQDNLTVKYDWHGLCLLNSRQRVTGRYAEPVVDAVLAQRQGWRVPRIYGVMHLPALLKRAEADTNFEGYVVEFSDGSRLKVKTPEYLKLNYLNSHFNKRLVWTAFHKGDTAYLEKLPDDVQGQVKTWLAEFALLTSEIIQLAEAVVDTLRGLPDRRSQAAIVTQWEPDYLRPLIFLLLDGKLELAQQRAGNIVIERYA